MSLYDSLSRPHIDESIKRFIDIEYKTVSDAEREYAYHIYADQQSYGKSISLSSLGLVFLYALSLIPAVFLYLPNPHS